MIRAIAAAGFTISLAAGAADIQKCADTYGNVTYQDSPCLRGQKIGALPRESAHGDPAAIRRLERERARLERAADAQIAAQRQESTTTFATPQQPATTATGVYPALPYNLAAISIDPATGAVIATGVDGIPRVIAPAPGTEQLPAGTLPQPQPGASSTTSPPPAITQPPTTLPSSIMSIPGAPSTSPASPPIANAPGTSR
jgi:hypothetical protein